MDLWVGTFSFHNFYWPHQYFLYQMPKKFLTTWHMNTETTILSPDYLEPFKTLCLEWEWTSVCVNSGPLNVYWQFAYCLLLSVAAIVHTHHSHCWPSACVALVDNCCKVMAEMIRPTYCKRGSCLKNGWGTYVYKFRWSHNFVKIISTFDHSARILFASQSISHQKRGIFP